jgi:hypothetical protein
MNPERPRDVLSVRIWPMSDKIPGFRERSIAEVQRHYFLNKLPRGKGRFRYLSSGLNAPPGTVVLFQFRARVIATALFVRDERFARPRSDHAGVLHFQPDSFQVFDPVDAAAMRLAWPRFRAFGHVKQRLHPEGYAAFERRLEHVARPVRSVAPHRRPGEDVQG